MLTEGALLVTLGAGAGILFARWGATLLVSFFAGVQNRILLDPRFDLRVLAFMAAVPALPGLPFSLAPALHATRTGPAKPPARPRAPPAKPPLLLGPHQVRVPRRRSPSPLLR